MSFNCELAEIQNEDAGIIIYDRYTPLLGGTLERKRSNGELIEGEINDTYNDGKKLHTGKYKEGKLVSFTNYYPNGKIEREFESKGGKSGLLKVYYESGKPRMARTYSKGLLVKVENYNPKGRMLYYIEYHKSTDYPLMIEDRTLAGKLKYRISLIDKKDLIYDFVEKDAEGKTAEKGMLQFDASKQQFKNEIGKYYYRTQENDPIFSKNYEYGDKMISKRENNAYLAIKKQEEENNIVSNHPYKDFDLNKNNDISVGELDSAINNFFEDDTIEAATIQGLINYFFEQDSAQDF